MNRIPSAPWLGWPGGSGMSPNVIASRTIFSVAARAGAGPTVWTAGNTAADAPTFRNERLSIVLLHAWSAATKLSWVVNQWPRQAYFIGQVHLPGFQASYVPAVARNLTEIG